MATSKRCLFCGETFEPYRSFQVRCSRPECKRKYRETIREHVNAQQRARFAANREKINAKSRAKRAANREKINARDRAWRAANREKRRAQQRARFAANREKNRAWRAANREKINAKSRAKRAANLEKYRARERRYQARNREKVNARQRGYKAMLKWREHEKPIDGVRVPALKKGETGWIYVILAEDFVKIGWTGKSIRGRLGTLRSGSPHRLRLIAAIGATKQFEEQIHDAFAAEHIRGEWFRNSPQVTEWIQRGCPLQLLLSLE